MEEADIRSAEVKKASYEFERDIVKGAVNQVLMENKFKIKSLSRSLLKDQSQGFFQQATSEYQYPHHRGNFILIGPHSVGF